MTGIIGYARVSTREQNPDAQEAELLAAGAGRVFVDHGQSSRAADRPQWVACLDYLRAGDTLVIRALDRVAGTELMAIEIIRDLGRRGVRLRSLTEPFLDVDTATPMGEAIVGIMAVMDSPADPSDRYITALVQEARRRWNVPVSQIGWYAEGRKPGQGIQAMGQSDEGGNVSIRRAGNKEEALLLEKSLCYPTTPGKLSRDYLNNEVVADEDYRGKNVLFTSVISEIARGAFNRPYVFFPSEEGSYTGLTCYFSNNDPNLRKIRKGSAVTVRCTVKGFLMQDVLLERCDILEVLSP